MTSHVAILQNPILQTVRLKTLCLIVVLFGCLLRFFEIFQNSFIFYDEGMYLQHNFELLQKIQQFPPKDIHEFFAIVHILFITALTTAKWLWFFISSIRVFFDGPDAFYFTRVISAVCGVMTIGLTFIFARKFFRSAEIAFLSASILAVLPSHVFYSRLAMQESFSTLCFIAGLYFYISNRNVSWHLVLSGVFFSAVYFTNYRMIILPVLIMMTEGILSLSENRRFDWIKFLLILFIFGAIVLLFGLMNHGSNLFITTAWMGRQAELAGQQGHWLNALSFPYAIYRLDGSVFFLMLLMGGLFFLSKNWRNLLPFSLVAVQMIIFSFASEKGARYLCVVLPFAAMSAGLVLNYMLFQSVHLKRWVPPVILGMLLVSLIGKAVSIVSTPKGYQAAVSYIQNSDSKAKILATQPIVVGLISGFRNEVAPAPKDFRELMIRYAQGFRFLIVDPQAYISWTQSGNRFTPPLVDYLGFVRDQLQPQIRYPQLTGALLERFVLDHNENLSASLSFLAKKNSGYGDIYVYDLTKSLEIMQNIVQAAAKSSGEK